MRGTVILTVIWFAGTAQGQEWTLLDDAGIMATLAGNTVQYDAYTVQSFAEDGKSLFVTERAADGIWAARDGKYCIAWPPSEQWECFDLYQAGDKVRFVAEDQSASEGTLVE